MAMELLPDVLNIITRKKNSYLKPFIAPIRKKILAKSIECTASQANKSNVL